MNLSNAKLAFLLIVPTCFFVMLRALTLLCLSLSGWCCSAVTRPCTAVVGVGDDDVEKLVPGAAMELTLMIRIQGLFHAPASGSQHRRQHHSTRKRECSRLSLTALRSIHAVGLSQREIKVLCFRFVSKSARFISFVSNKVRNWT